MNYILFFLQYFNFRTINFYNLFLSYLNNFKINFVLNFIISFFYFFFYNISILFSTLIIFSFTSLHLTKKFIILLDFYVGYYKIHPTLFYFSIHYIFFYLYNNKNNLNSKNILLFITITFALGSLWALYQNIWGYYWSNDSIEYILCFFYLFIAIKLHQFYKIYSTFMFIYLICILFLIIMLRLNFIYTKHNFFKLESNYDNFFFFIIFFFFINFFFLLKKLNTKKFLLINNFLIFSLILIISLILFNILNWYNISFFIYFLFIFYLFFIIFLFKNLNYKNYKTHFFIFIFILIYNNFNLQYIISYNNYSNNFNVNTNIFFKHKIFNNYYNKKKKILHLINQQNNYIKYNNSIKYSIFKLKQLNQKLINYF